MKNNIPDFSPDILARIVLFLVRWRAQVPGWRIDTLSRLVTSEVEGIVIIEDVLPQVTDPRIRQILQKHLDDERRHARVFSERYRAVLEARQLPFTPPAQPSQQLQKFNLLTLVAYLETQESRAIPLLETYAELFQGDEETVHWITRNIKDEKFHATWTHHQLEKWIQEGRGEEVRRARAEARLTDKRAFCLQLFAFLKAAPGLILKGYAPPLFRKTPSPL